MKDKMLRWTYDHFDLVLEAATMAAMAGFGYICFALGRLDAQC